MTDAIRGIIGAGESPGINPSGTAKGSTGTDGAASGTGAAVDSANVDQTQSLLQTINAAADATPSVNQAQIAALRAAIGNGTYQIDPQNIAKQLVNSDQALGAAASGE